MRRKVLSHHVKKKIPYRKRRTLRISRGKASIGVLAIILFVVMLSASFVFGKMNLSPESNIPTAAGYTCCDSGDGDACAPNTTVSLKVNLDGYRLPKVGHNGDDVPLVQPYSGEQVYYLLKSNVKMAEQGDHLQPVPDKAVLMGPSDQPINIVKPGQHLYFSNAEDKWTDSYQGECENQGQTDRNPPIFRDSVWYSHTGAHAKCAAFPNDELVYVCTSGCDQNGTPLKAGDTAIFDTYFRAVDIQDNKRSDPQNPNGIPNVIKNCEKPDASTITPGQQQVIVPPNSSSKQNLQLETFTVGYQQGVADWVSPYCKPAVYLYPKETTTVHVGINPQGKLLTTIPLYPSGGWTVTAHPDGVINYQGSTYDYLYYEASLPDEKIVLPDNGYVVSYSDLPTFLPNLVTKLGLNEKERSQFNEYWLKVLPKSAYYKIQLVSEKTLDTLSPLSILPVPKTVIRVTLHFEPLDKKINLQEPHFTTPVRDGFTVVEWGGIYKQDKDHPFSCFM